MSAKTSPSIGGNIKAARIAAGITQLALAHALGYSGDDAGAYISRVEAGLSVPRVDTLQRIAGVLGVQLGELVGK